MRRAAIAVLAAALVATACSSSSSGSAGAKGDVTITVYAASSLTGTFTALGHAFEQAHPGYHVRFNFGASSTLATAIVNGAPADVFASAAPKNMATVVTSGDAVNPADFAKNVLEIAVPPGNPAHVTTVSDLARPSVKVALCEPTVPCGVVAEQVFANAHVQVHAVSLEQDVKSTLAKVQLGEVDAGVVYVTDVRAAGSKVLGVPIASAVNASTAYPIAALSHSHHRDVATLFVAFVTSPAGQSVLRAAGFLPP